VRVILTVADSDKNQKDRSNIGFKVFFGVTEAEALLLIDKKERE
jgi:hypothetical protein